MKEKHGEREMETEPDEGKMMCYYSVVRICYSAHTHTHH